MPQSRAAANPWHQEEEKKDRNWHMQNKQTNALFSMRDDHNAQQNWKNTRTNSKAWLNTKRPVVESLTPHKLRTTQGPPT